MATTARGQVGAITTAGRLVRLDVVAAPEVERAQEAPSLAAGTPVGLLVEVEPGEQVVGLVWSRARTGPARSRV